MCLLHGSGLFVQGSRLPPPPPSLCSYEMVQKKLKEIAASRGKTTRLDRQDQARTQPGGVTAHRPCPRCVRHAFAAPIPLPSAVAD